jgi:hypothetical protein
MGCEFESVNRKRYAASYLLEHGGNFYQLGRVERVGWWRKYPDCETLAQELKDRFLGHKGQPTYEEAAGQNDWLRQP